MAVASIKDANHFSISRLAEMFGHTRETIGKKIKESGVKPCSKRGGYPVYNLRDVAEFTGGAFVADQTPFDQCDPDKLPPKDRDSWFASELKRKKLEKEDGFLLDKNDTHEKLSELFKKVALSLDTLADVLERDIGLSPELIDKVNEVCDNTREELVNNIIGDSE